MRSSNHFASIALACVAALGLSRSSALVAMEPGKLEPKITAADTAAPQPAAIKVPSSNPLSGDPEAINLGKRLFFTWCVQCHGPKANGESRFGKYAGDLTRFWRGYKEFVVIVKDGRVQKMMPPWKEVLDDDNIAKVGAYLETLAVEGANWQ
jgi:cytochrome c oxidase cbb3-type subunit III